MGASPSLTGAGVSEREAEVLALVGEHLTKKQSPAWLYLSVRTVESHVSSLPRSSESPTWRVGRARREPGGPCATRLGRHQTVNGPQSRWDRGAVLVQRGCLLRRVCQASCPQGLCEGSPPTRIDATSARGLTDTGGEGRGGVGRSCRSEQKSQRIPRRIEYASGPAGSAKVLSTSYPKPA